MERSGLEPLPHPSLHHALRGAVFPLSVEQLVWLARENEAPASMLTLLSGLPRGAFASCGAVQQGIEALTAQTIALAETPPVTPASR